MPNQILQDIIDNFSIKKFNSFFREKSDKYNDKEENLSRYDRDIFSNTTRLGYINFGGRAKDVAVAGVKTNQDLTERSSKKAQYEFAKELLKKEDKYEAGIFIFYDAVGNFRFSLVYPQYQGTKRIWNTFRRFTYFVSKDLRNKTFKQQIGEGDLSGLNEIRKAFSVEPVTNKFFDEFRFYFEKTKKEFEITNKNTVCLWLKDRYSNEEYKEQINKFAYTFLGRIIFVYFLQRKGWIENDNNFFKKIIEEKNNSLLYLNFLQPLFFDVFAKKENERPIEIKKQYKDTPYLNGGLFERSNLENELEMQGKFILFDDKFIRNLILDFFENYNFTIDENSPEDQEVSIDPEMLGKVFENTLAEEERGEKGTFYTPREVVHFMVKDSLWQFLRNETEIDKEKLHKLIYNEEELESINFKKEEIRKIDEKLQHIKVLDPAVGSAAFPVEMMQVLVDLRKRLNVNVGKNINEVSLKKHFIKENLYGVDIDPGAIEIAKLRLWLALIVDYEKSDIEPLPNLDFQFRVGNSLQEKVAGFEVVTEKYLLSKMSKNEQAKLFSLQERKQGAMDFMANEASKEVKEMEKIIEEYFEEDNEEKKKEMKKKFDSLEQKIFQARINDLRNMADSKIHLLNGEIKELKEAKKYWKEVDELEKKLKYGTYKLFIPKLHFFEVYNKNNGFDIVIGNPPYGVRVEDDIKDWHGLGSKDSYGVFISTALKRFLKPGGVLSYIVSDTWLTIKTHKELREQVLAKQLHKIIRLNQDCFEATVNACIMSLSNSDDCNDKVVVADLTNISTRKNVLEMREKLYGLEKFIGESTPIFAVYEYNQDLIKTNSNLPIFVGSSKLFALINDTTCQTKEKEIAGKKVNVRQIEINGKNIELVRFGDIAEIKQGLATGDNDYYLFQNPEARGNYKSIKEYKEFLLNGKDLEKISNDNILRMKVVKNGFHKSESDKKFDKDLWFGGRYIATYDKGGESDTETGWLPNYYVPTNYYIDWSQEAVKRLKSFTIRQRDGKGEDRVCSRLQNVENYFESGITFSITGLYAPSFRKNSSGVFDVKGSYINSPIKIDDCLGILVSKIIKMFSKLFIYNCVDMQVDAIKEIPFCVFFKKEITELVKQIIKKQKINPRYDYMSNEQKEIDRLVYEMYGLNKEDIKEVETWYARRYPKLARFCDIKK